MAKYQSNLIANTLLLVALFHFLTDGPPWPTERSNIPTRVSVSNN